MLGTALTYAILGVEAHEVRVEVDVRKQGLPSFSLVGLPDAAVRESRERVRAALENSGFKFPLYRITANLAPADLRKAGPGFDLAIAAALLAASEQLPQKALAGCAVAGELALDGSIRPVAGTLAMAESARRAGLTRIAVAVATAPEAALANELGSNGRGDRRLRVVPLERLQQLSTMGSATEPQASRGVSLRSQAPLSHLPDLADVRGQPGLRRALEVAAAGGHGLLVTGPPGAGKSLALRRLPSILPPLGRREAIEVLRIASACGRHPAGVVPCARPFRAPHHTISVAGLVGGGTPPRAGEITLAHRGVLCLDELPEFPRDALEALRQPLEDGRVAIVRARHAVELPCRFMLVAAANPCPCGHGSDSGRCDCSAVARRRYGARLSGPLADRLDLTLAVEQPPPETMSGPPGEGSASVRQRVVAAREAQEERLGEGRCNGEMAADELRRHVRLDAAARGILRQGVMRLGLSGRGHDRVLRIARTVADLDDSKVVRSDHLAEALSLRRRRSAQ